MDPQKAKTIFLHAVEHVVPIEWPRYLDDACADDPSLRHGVELLLAAHQQDVDLADQARQACHDALPTVDLPLSETTGAQIGPYKLLQSIGEGGMGVVYMAEQKTPVKRRVALKIIKPGMDTRQVIARFEAERQALAMMDHPNIAKVLDVGATESGRPYFVMELVKGIAITKYCDGQQLSLRERLELFIPVCRAVQHAHQKGIIHRDLKPSNILVALFDGHPVPKVIDFGVAKATGQELTEKTVFTQFGQIVGTVEYMSPEQAQFNQLDIDTRSDVYSLGVLLYELLTGEAPFDKARLRSAAFDEMMRIIREEEPPRPSMRLSTIHPLPSVATNRRVEPARLSSLLRGELDWIVMKSLEKDRARRYQSANGFVDDIKRYLNDEAVVACPPSTAYRFRKFARRNKAKLAMAAALGVALLLGLAGTSWQAIRATESQRQAETQAERADGEAKRATLEQRKSTQAFRQIKDEQAITHAALARERRTSYRHSIALAYSDWMANNVQRAEELLEDCPIDLRHWEWHYLKRLCRGTELSWSEPWSEIRGVSFSPNGKLLAFGGGNIGFGPFVSDQQLSLWDVERRQRLGDFRQTKRQGAITGLAFSPDSSRLAIALWCLTDARDVLTMDNVNEDDAGRVEIWDLKSKQLVQSLKSHRKFVNAVAFSPDGRRVASASSDRTVHIWDVDSADKLLTLEHQGQAMSVAFSPDGKMIATGSQGPLESNTSATLNDRGEVTIWDATTGVKLKELVGQSRGVFSVHFNFDSQLLASAGRDGVVVVWDVASGDARLRLFGHTDSVTSVRFSPDGRRVATSGKDRTLRIWNAENGEQLQVYRGHTGSVSAVDWHPDNRRLASVEGWERSTQPSVRIWDTELPIDVITCTGHSEQVNQLQFSADGQLVASGSGGQGGHSQEIRVFRTHDGEQICQLPRTNGHNSFRLMADSRHLIAMTGGSTVDVAIFDVTDASQTSGFSLERNRTKDGPTWSPELSTLGKYLATFDAGRHAVLIWDTDDGRLQRQFPISTIDGHFRGRSVSVVFSPCGERLAAVTNVRTDLWRTNDIRVWNLKTGAEVLQLQPDNLLAHHTTFSPDGRLLAWGNAAKKQNELIVWRLDQPERLPIIILGEGKCHGLHFFPAGNRLISVHDEKRLMMRVWDLLHGTQSYVLDSFSPRRPSIYYGGDVAFAPDGRRVITSGDGTIKIWDADDGHSLLTFSPGLRPSRISSDGRCIAAAAQQGRLFIWQSDLEAPMP